MTLKPEIQTLIVSDAQRAIDQAMISYDIWGSTAHLIMLSETGILPKDRAQKILSALREIQARYDKGDFQIDPSRGAQLSLEKAIIDIAGEEAGLSLHTARSRNDQVMITEMLYVRDQVLNILQLILDVNSQLLIQAKQHQETVMPGYTHMQPGKPTTFCSWCLAFFDAFQRGFDHLIYVLSAYDRSALGSVESFGTSWQINRERTAELLGFASVWEVPQDAISHRGLFQLSVLGALSELAVSLSKIATDLMLYSTFEYGMVDFGEDVAQRMHPQTGSSVMPQKRNPDALELIRGSCPQIAAAYQAAFGILQALPSGYNRDSREVKEHISIGVTKTVASLSALKYVISSLVVDKKRMLELVNTNYSLTTDIADYLSQVSKLPYRLVYKIVGKAADECITKKIPLQNLSAEKINQLAKELGANLSIAQSDISNALDPASVLSRRKHTGGSAKEIAEKMCEQRQTFLENRTNAIKKLVDKITVARNSCEAIAL